MVHEPHVPQYSVVLTNQIDRILRMRIYERACKMHESSVTDAKWHVINDRISMKNVVKYIIDVETILRNSFFLSLVSHIYCMKRQGSFYCNLLIPLLLSGFEIICFDLMQSFLSFASYTISNQRQNNQNFHIYLSHHQTLAEQFRNEVVIYSFSTDVIKQAHSHTDYYLQERAYNCRVYDYIAYIVGENAPNFHFED